MEEVGGDYWASRTVHARKKQERSFLLIIIHEDFCGE